MSDLIIPVVMPKWGLTMKEGLLAAWHVDEGDTINPGDEVMDVETDKIANVVEATESGLLRRKVGEEGKTYPCQAVLGVLAPEEVSDAEIDEFLASYIIPEPDEEEEEAGPVYEFAELSFGKMRYEHRDGEGTPIILIHGFGGDLGNWIFNIDSLAAKSPVYAIDLPGHGQSEKKIENPDLSFMVSSVIELLDILKINKAHLIGHSMGGLISSRVALDHPEKVESICLIGSAGLGKDINSDYIDGFVNSVNKKELKPKLSYLFADPSLVNRSMIDDLLKFKRLDGVDTFLKSLSKSLFPDGNQNSIISNDLDNLDMKILIIHGEKDAIINSSHANSVSNAVLEIIPDAGHNVQLEQASKVNELILNHIS